MAGYHSLFSAMATRVVNGIAQTNKTTVVEPDHKSSLVSSLAVERN